ncbi:secretion protein F [Anaeromicropila populeti]|uniref:Tight adherence protein C n=1 Tax=Anaeromicropila populeti TaxID=37658 RepID=A0A1I6JFG1_9FIRM|nr:secretion protein F [Anaeromicropila populeti]SFR77718.1 hypothetical protein SAMN05661086_01640 [Anaeromicropila populeti]
MLFIIRVLTFLGMAYGSYTLITSVLKLPTYRTEKTAHIYTKKSSLIQLELMIQRMSAWLSQYIHLDEYKRSKLEQELKSLGIEKTPEIFKATSVVTAGLVLTLIIPCLLIMPIISVGVVVLSILVYFKEDNQLREKIAKKREAIELELPRFCSTIKQELMATRDVLTILENYRKNAGAAMKKELDITCADMRSGNYESALLRLEARITSAALSDVIRGLLGTLRGDDNRGYFEILSHDMDNMEIQRLEAQAAKQPGKIKKYLMLLLACMLVMYLLILGMYAMQNLTF